MSSIVNSFENNNLRNDQLRFIILLDENIGKFTLP